MLAESHPYIRRTIRFCLLPYCYFKLVPWHECTKSKLQVAKDLLYIFFKFKYYPDNYGPCRLWEKNRKEWCYYYGSTYNPYPRVRLRKFVQRHDYQIVFNDKELCDQFCRSLNVSLPLYLGTVEPGDASRKKIQDIMEKKCVDKIILKPILGHAGQGIMLASREGNDIVVQTMSKSFELNKLHLKSQYVAQEVIEQHEKISEICPTSVNTIRIVTLLTTDNKVVILGAKMRFGINGSFVDNSSAGGIGAGVNCETGILNDNSFDKLGKKYTKHPVTHARFSGFSIPMWEEVKEMAYLIQKGCKFYRLIGSDIAVTPNGPVLIEVNANPDIVGLESSYGPILAKRDVFEEFEKYGLIFNNYQKTLFD